MSIVKRSVDAATARRAIAAAVAKSVEMGKMMSIAITDEAGVLKAFERMDGASQLSIDISQNKAFTAASFRLPTHVWYDFIKDDPPLLHGIVHTPRLIIFGGGFPIVESAAFATSMSSEQWPPLMPIAPITWPLAAIGMPAA